MGGTCAFREEPGKQKPRSCRAQELARSRAQENARQKMRLPKSEAIGFRRGHASNQSEDIENLDILSERIESGQFHGRDTCGHLTAWGEFVFDSSDIRLLAFATMRSL
jgi:hypothetical protein